MHFTFLKKKKKRIAANDFFLCKELPIHLGSIRCISDQYRKRIRSQLFERKFKYQKLLNILFRDISEYSFSRNICFLHLLNVRIIMSFAFIIIYYDLLTLIWFEQLDNHYSIDFSLILFLLFFETIICVKNRILAWH